MNGRKSKILRHIFKDRKEYRRMKVSYTRGTTDERLRASQAMRKIKRSGKSINYRKIGAD